MSFSNLIVDPDEIPRAADVDFKALAPAYPREVLVNGLLVVVPFVIASLVPGIIVVKPAALKAWLFLLPLLPLGLGLILLFLSVKRARLAGYALREHDIVFRKGLFFRKTVVLPFNRVQHAEVSVGPLQRRFGLASLKLFTAGGSSVDLQIDGFTREQAEKLRDHITAHGD
ncbi:MAG: PH domain-containing protein [Xanthomonadales bacterium]|nr:PH domain-containing protein [Xanthomonadales bacterium]